MTDTVWADECDLYSSNLINYLHVKWNLAWSGFGQNGISPLLIVNHSAYVPFMNQRQSFNDCLTFLLKSIEQTVQKTERKYFYFLVTNYKPAEV